MTEKEKEQVALFRYGLISPVLNGQTSHIRNYFATQCDRPQDVPVYGFRQFSEKTLWRWLHDYRVSGFEGLKPGVRDDLGKSRKVSAEKEARLVAMREMRRDLPLTVFYDELVKEGEIVAGEASFATIYRLLRKYDLVRQGVRKQGDRKRFAHENANELWQGDAMEGPFVPFEGRKVKTILLAFIDDCSRLVPYAMFAPDGRLSCMLEVLQQALIRRGIPRLLYLDNGKIYRSQTLQIACASLGITVIHTQAYDPQSKGKIERFFKTVQTRFTPLLREKPAGSLDELNSRFWTWLEEDYHRRPHSALENKMSPLDRFLSQASLLRLVNDPENLSKVFLNRIQRKVRNDATVSVRNILFEVPPRYIGQTIEIRYNDHDFFIYENGYEQGRITAVNYHDNAHMKRESRISFKELAGEL